MPFCITQSSFSAVLCRLLSVNADAFAASWLPQSVCVFDCWSVLEDWVPSDGAPEAVTPFRASDRRPHHMGETLGPP